MISVVDIIVAARDEKSFLKKGFFTPPFKVANISGWNGKRLDLMLMCSSPGVLDQDNISVDIKLEKGSQLELHTQSFQRLFPMLLGSAQRMTVRMDEGSSFTYMPHPTVPHKDSLFKSVNRIFLSGGCSLFWGEVLTCGRKLNDEIFQYTSFQNLTEIFFGGRLVVKENLIMQPEKKNPRVMGQLEGFTHQASLIFWKDGEAMKERSDAAVELLSVEKEMAVGVTSISERCIMIRMLGNHAEQLHACMKNVAETWKTKIIPEKVTIAP
jgi:urease accessory protein